MISRVKRQGFDQGRNTRRIFSPMILFNELIISHVNGALGN